MTCVDDCNDTSSTCHGNDEKTYDESTSGTTTISDSYCSTTYYSDWAFTHNVCPITGSGEAYNELAGSYNDYFLNSWYTDTPDTLTEEGCAYGGASMDSVEYVIRQSDGDTNGDYEFQEPVPQGDSSNTDQILEEMVSIASAAGSTYHPAVAVGGAIVKAYMSNSGDPVSLTKDRTWNDTQRIQWWWDINTYSEFPTGVCDSTSVKFEISPGVNTYSNAKVFTWVRYTNSIWEYSNKDRDYECDCRSVETAAFNHQTDWLQKAFVFDIV